MTTIATLTVYGTKVTPYLATRIAAWVAQAPAIAPDIDFPGGLLVVGDGGGAVPTVDELIGNGGVLSEVWRGATIGGVQVDPNNPNQVDILCVIPEGVNGTEIGPFTVREFAIYVQDGEALQLAVVGTTTLEKTTSAQGQTSDLIWIAAISVSSAQPIIQTDPSAYFATMIDVRNAFNAHRMKATAPFLISENTTSTGWIEQTGAVRAADKPAEPAASAPVVDAAKTGYGRPATDAEFAAGGSLGSYAWPWPTIAQVKGMIPTIPPTPGALAPLSYNGGANRYECALATGDDVRSASATNKVVTPKSLADATAFQTLVDQATITWDFAAGFNARVAIAANRTLALPTNAFVGETGMLYVQQGAGGNFTLAFAAGWDFGANGPPPGSTTAGKWDAYSVQCVRAAATGVTPLFAIALVAKGLTL